MIPCDIAQVNVGDIITYMPNPDNSETMVTHRVIKITAEDGIMLATKGDANPVADATPVTKDNLYGIVVKINSNTLTYDTEPDDPGPPPNYDKSIDTAKALADYFTTMLNLGRDLTGDENAMDSWQELFDAGNWPVTAVGLKETPDSENLYQFQLNGAYVDRYIDVTVYINMQEDEPWFFCPYTHYYPYVRPVAEAYLSLIAEGDVRELAAWLSVDGGPSPTDDFMRQAEWAITNYGSYDLSATRVESVAWVAGVGSNDMEQRLFQCTVKDAKGNEIVVLLEYGDGLIRPVVPMT